MGEAALENIFAFWPLPAAALLLLLLGAMGWLGRDTFDHAPHRAAGLQPLDLLIGLAILMAGSQFALLAQRLLALHPEANGTGLQQAAATLLGQVIGQGPVVVYVLVRVRRQPRGPKEFGLTPRQPRRELVAAIVGLVVSLPLVFAANWVCVVIGSLIGHPAPVDELGHDMLRAMRQADSHVALALMISSAVIVAPLLEEIFFRGLVQTTLLELFGRKRRWTAILLASLAFVVPHIGTGAWHVLPGLLVLAMLLGWLYERTGSLLPCVLAHIAFNGLNIVLAFGKPVSMDAAAALGLSVVGGHWF